MQWEGLIKDLFIQMYMSFYLNVKRRRYLDVKILRAMLTEAFAVGLLGVSSS